MNIIRQFVLWYIRSRMAHEHADARGEIFAAIHDGMKDAFWEDNANTRLYSAIRWMVENGKEFQPYNFLGKRINPDSEDLANCAYDATRDATRDTPLNQWRIEKNRQIHGKTS